MAPYNSDERNSSPSAVYERCLYRSNIESDDSDVGDVLRDACCTLVEYSRHLKAEIKSNIAFIAEEEMKKEKLIACISFVLRDRGMNDNLIGIIQRALLEVEVTSLLQATSLIMRAIYSDIHRRFLEANLNELAKPGESQNESTSAWDAATFTRVSAGTQSRTGEGALSSESRDGIPMKLMYFKGPSTLESKRPVLGVKGDHVRSRRQDHENCFHGPQETHENRPEFEEMNTDAHFLDRFQGNLDFPSFHKISDIHAPENQAFFSRQYLSGEGPQGVPKKVEEDQWNATASSSGVNVPAKHNNGPATEDSTVNKDVADRTDAAALTRSPKPLQAAQLSSGPGSESYHSTTQPVSSQVNEAPATDRSTDSSVSASSYEFVPAPSHTLYTKKEPPFRIPRKNAVPRLENLEKLRKDVQFSMNKKTDEAEWYPNSA